MAILLYMLNWFITRTPSAILEEYGWSEKQQKLKNKKDKKVKKDKKKKKALI